MAKANSDFLKLQTGYLFPEVAKRIRAWEEKHAGEKVKKLSIGNTTEALTPYISNAMINKINKLQNRNEYTGYGDEQGDESLRNALMMHYRKEYGVKLSADEFFVSDGAKSDAANIQEIFSKDSVVAIQDPAYPVYVDSNVAGGHSRNYNDRTSSYDGLIYLEGNAENRFVASVPCGHADLIYLCFPNNPTGAVATREELKDFIDYARREKAIIVFDAAYSDYIESKDIPHSIYEIEGAEEVAIEINSFSKNAGFTGVRLGWSVVPKTLRLENGDETTINRLWNRRECTFFNGASNIAQAGGLAALEEEGRKECLSLVNYYKENARIILSVIRNLGLECYGGIDSPYVWTKCPDGLSSWEFFDLLLEKAHVAVTPGSGFGKAGEGYVRISSYGHREDVISALGSIKENF